jgi:hypothetical protein
MLMWEEEEGEVEVDLSMPQKEVARVVVVVEVGVVKQVGRMVMVVVVGLTAGYI